MPNLRSGLHSAATLSLLQQPGKTKMAGEYEGYEEFWRSEAAHNASDLAAAEHRIKELERALAKSEATLARLTEGILAAPQVEPQVESPTTETSPGDVTTATKWRRCERKTCGNDFFVGSFNKKQRFCNSSCSVKHLWEIGRMGARRYRIEWRRSDSNPNQWDGYLDVDGSGKTFCATVFQTSITPGAAPKWFVNWFGQDRLGGVEVPSLVAGKRLAQEKRAPRFVAVMRGDRT